MTILFDSHSLCISKRSITVEDRQRRQSAVECSPPLCPRLSVVSPLSHLSMLSDLLSLFNLYYLSYLSLSLDSHPDCCLWLCAVHARFSHLIIDCVTHIHTCVDMIVLMMDDFMVIVMMIDDNDREVAV